MKIKIITSIAAVIILTLTLCTGCTKDTVTGPTGATGPIGATGPAGNVNVQYYTYTTIPNDWTTSNDSVIWSANYSSVTVNPQDALLVYVVTSGSGTNSVYTALPNTVNNIQTGYSNNLVTIFFNVSSTNNTKIPKPGILTFKIILIPSSLRLAGVNYNNFAEVKKAHHLY